MRQGIAFDDRHLAFKNWRVKRLLHELSFLGCEYFHPLAPAMGLELLTQMASLEYSGLFKLSKKPLSTDELLAKWFWNGSRAEG